MKFEVEINKKDLEKAIVEKLAQKIFQEYKDHAWSFYGISKDASDIFEERAKTFLKRDPNLGKGIDRLLKARLKDEKLIGKVAKKIIEERLDD